MQLSINKWYQNYALGFTKHGNSSPYLLRYKHSLRVSSNAKDIALKSGFSPEEAEISSLIGLLHDCGRFEQFEKYQTFNDKLSIDHAEHSVTILKKLKILNEYNPSSQQLIFNSIRFHNKKELPIHKLASTELKFAKLLRDADKLDSFQTKVNQLQDTKLKKQTSNLNQPEKITYSKNILEAIRKHKSANFEDIKTDTDFRIVQLSWIFDINFKATFQMLIKQKNFNYLLENMPGKENITNELKEINKFIHTDEPSHDKKFHTLT